MQSHSSKPRRAPYLLVGLVVILCTATLSAPAAIAKPPDNPGSVAPHGQPYGKSYGDWGAAWWSWAASFPPDQDPISELSGPVEFGDADDQPAGPVWFLAGTFEGSVERSLTVPSSKALFFPLVNFVYWNPEDCEYFSLPRCRATDLRHKLIEVQEQTTGLELSIEKSVPGGSTTVTYERLEEYSAISRTFTLDIPEGSLFTAYGYDAGPRYPSVSGGHWMMLAPLAPGQYTIHWFGQAGGPNAESDPQNITYDLTVT